MVEDIQDSTQHLEKTIAEEIREVLEYLGRHHEDGEVKGRHIATILYYLIRQKTEEYTKTLSKLSLMLGINRRWLRENYFDGLEAFGLIEIYINNNRKMWRWKGLKEG